MQEEYRDKKNLYMRFVNIEKAFDRVPKKVKECAMRKKGLPKLIVRAVMSLYHVAKTKVRVGSELFEELLIQVCIHQGSVLSPIFLRLRWM